MATKNVACDYTEEFLVAPTPDDYYANADQCIFGEASLSNVRCARIQFAGLDIGAGTITSAIIYFRAYNMAHSLSRTIRFAASNTAGAYTTSIGSDYVSQALNPSAESDFSIDVTSKIAALADVNSTFYVFGFQASPSAAGNDYCIDWHGYGSAYKPYIALTYTPAANPTIGLYDLTLEDFKNRIIKKRVSGAWVDCDCYKYNGSTWEKVSTT
jgi:hypothetical protein